MPAWAAVRRALGVVPASFKSFEQLVFDFGGDPSQTLRRCGVFSSADVLG